MIIWINGSFGVGKTETAMVLKEKLPNAHIYDPEQVGYFLWDNFPKSMKRKGDFQDISIWRTINYDVIKYMNDNDDGHIIIPMTLVNSQYYDEIIGRLEKEDVSIKHFVLMASKETIVSRLIHRGESQNSWAEQQIDRCLSALTSDISGIKINTDLLSVTDVADYILKNI